MSRQTLTLRVNAAGSWAKLARIDADDLPVAAQLLDAILQIAHGRVKFDAITDSGEHLPPIDTHGLRSRIAWEAWLNRRTAPPSTITPTTPPHRIAHRRPLMNQKELIQTVANVLPEVSRTLIGEVLRTAGAVTAETLAFCVDERVDVPGFGKFSASDRAPRIGRNPKTGAEVAIPGRRVARFAARKSFREALEG